MSINNKQNKILLDVIVFMIAMFLLPLISFAQEKQMLVDKVDQLQKLDDAKNKLDQLKNLIDSSAREKYYKCVKAFGDNKFCKCLSDNLPVVDTFEDYIVIVTSSKDELNYNNRTKEDKEIIDLTYKAREMCVNLDSAREIKKTQEEIERKR